jgi:type IV secretory pathway VirB10-like protein
MGKVAETKKNEEVKEDNVSIGQSKGNKTAVYAIVAVLVSVVFYYMFFSDPGETTQRQNLDEITIGGGGGDIAPAGDGLGGFNPVLDSLDVVPSLDSGTFEGANTNANIPQIPTLPEIDRNLSDSILANIASPVEEAATETATPAVTTYTREEVDAMIQDRIREVMEERANAMSNNANNVATETVTTRKVTTRRRVPIINPETGGEEIVEVDVEEDVPVSDTGTGNARTAQNNNNSDLEFEDELMGLERPAGGAGGAVAGIDEDILEIGDADNPLSAKRRVSQERKTAPIFKMAGGSGPTMDTTNDEPIILTFATNAKMNIETKPPDISGQQVQDLSNMILQGKIINAILETAIDTSEPSTVRAVITKDVYAEEGKNVLIPRGSRVIGSYSSEISAGRARLMINWSRIIRIDGMSLNIASIAADRLGRAGITGELDNKYASRLANTLLSSVLNIGMAIAADKINKSNVSIISGNDGTSTTGSGGSLSLMEVTRDFGEESRKILEELDGTLKPVIRVGQGERIIIMVTQDVTLPVYRMGK